MKKDYDFVIVNSLLTNAQSEDELSTIFNDKLASLFVLYEKINQGGCNDT